MADTKKVTINGDFITLGQLLKEAGVIPTGGAAKWFLKEHQVLVNEQPEDRRGKKLRSGDTVTIPEQGQWTVQ